MSTRHDDIRAEEWAFCFPVLCLIAYWRWL